MEKTGRRRARSVFIPRKQLLARLPGENPGGESARVARNTAGMVLGERRKGIWALQVSTDVYGENRGCEGGIGARKEEGIHVPRRTARGQGGASTRGRVDVGREMRKTLASRFSVAARERINGEAAIGVLIPPFPPRNQLQIATDSRQRRSSRRSLLELLQGADSGKEADLASGSGVAVKAHACKRWRAPQRGCR